MAAARDLAGLLNSSANTSALTRHYKRVIKGVIEELARGVTNPGAARARDLLATIRRLTDKLDPAKSSFVRKWIRREIPRAFILGDKAATRQLRESLLKETASDQRAFGKISRGFTGANSAAMRALVGSMEARLGRAAADTFATAGLAIRQTQLTTLRDKSIREATVSGVIRGRTGRELRDNVARILLGGQTNKSFRELRAQGFGGETLDLYKNLAQGQFITVNGRKFDIRFYANLVARTQSREAHKVATVVRLQQNGVDHVKISRHAQLEKDECTPFAGKVFYVGSESEDPAGFPPLKGILNAGPPFHPNCRHVAQPFVVKFMGKKAVENALKSSKALPARFTRGGKTSKDIRDDIFNLTNSELEEIAAEGVADLKRGEAA